MGNVRFNSNSLLDGLGRMKVRTEQAILMFAQTQATKFESDAKSQARWTDRTGHARQRLKGTVEKVPEGYKIKLAHGVDYGLWLELANEKKYAIVEPIIRTKSPYVIRDLNNLLERLK